MTASRIVSRGGSASVQSRNFSPILGLLSVIESWRKVGDGRVAYHASRARGLEFKMKPIVLGLVACSIAYAVPDSFQSAHLLRPAFSTSDSSSLTLT